MFKSCWRSLLPCFSPSLLPWWFLRAARCCAGEGGMSDSPASTVVSQNMAKKKTPQTLPQATASPFFFIGQQVAVRETQRNSVQLRHNVTESVATKQQETTNRDGHKSLSKNGLLDHDTSLGIQAIFTYNPYNMKTPCC